MGQVPWAAQAPARFARRHLHRPHSQTPSPVSVTSQNYPAGEPERFGGRRVRRLWAAGQVRPGWAARHPQRRSRPERRPPGLAGAPPPHPRARRGHSPRGRGAPVRSSATSGACRVPGRPGLPGSPADPGRSANPPSRPGGRPDRRPAAGAAAAPPTTARGSGRCPSAARCAGRPRGMPPPVSGSAGSYGAARGSLPG